MLAPGLVSYVWFTPYHPLNRLPAVANIVLSPLFRRYGRLPMPNLKPLVAEADLIVFESTSGLMLVDRFRAWSPTARFVYRVSDDLRMLKAHPVVLEAETRALPQFDLISVPSEYILRLFGGRPHVELQYHGLETADFDRATENPYGPGSEAHAVFVGTAYLDTDFLELAARDHPDWEFHVIGAFDKLAERRNLIAHGELPFAETVPYLQHADVGLSPLRYRPGLESLTDSLKIVQYTYCRLPIVAPDFLRSSRTNVFSYRPGDAASIHEALTAARAFDRSTVDRSAIGTWDDLARKLAGPLADEATG
jgi:2-beta-glucuronyltransferase